MSETLQVSITSRNVVVGVGAMIQSGCATEAYAQGGAPVVPYTYDESCACRRICEQSGLVTAGVLGTSIAPVRLVVPPGVVVQLCSERNA